MLLPGYKSWRMRNTKNIVLLAKRKEIHQFSQSFIYSMTRISLSSAGLFPFPFFFSKYVVNLHYKMTRLKISSFMF